MPRTPARTPVPKAAAAPARRTSRTQAPRRLVVLVATRKGAWLFHGDARRKTWQVDGPHFLGHIVSHLRARPARRPHAAGRGPDRPPRPDRLPLDRTSAAPGRRRRSRPPSRRRRRAAPAARSTTPSGSRRAMPRERDTWYAGTSPQGLFRSEDGGVSWTPIASVNDDAQFREWMGTVQDGTPDGPKLHSIIVDPRDPAHLYFGDVGRRRARVDRRRAHWTTADRGAWRWSRVSTPSTITFHDPHGVRLCPSNPDRLYQQNHCGIYRLDRPGDDLGAHRPQDAQARRRHRLSRWSCTRATTTPPGSSRWTAPTSGRAPARRGARRPTSRAMAARPGSAWTPACPRARPGGPSSARR